MIRNNVEVTVPAKCILLGEYAVVEGWPAIAFSVPQYTTTVCLTLSDSTKYNGASQEIVLGLCNYFNVKAIVNIESTIPMSVGLGSSAAFLVALISALAKVSTKAEIDLFRLAWEWEHRLHNGKSSGLDIAACMVGMQDMNRSVVIKYEKGNVQILDLSLPPNLCIYDSGIQRAAISVNWDSGALREIGEATKRFMSSEPLQKLFKEALQFQIALGIVPCELQEKLGDLVWKMTGAGKGGCFIVLYSSNDTSVPLTNTRLIWRSSPL